MTRLRAPRQVKALPATVLVLAFGACVATGLAAHAQAESLARVPAQAQVQALAQMQAQAQMQALAQTQAQAPAPESEDPAVVAYRSGRYEEAINSVRVRTNAETADADDYRLLVAVLTEVGRYEQAERTARDFIAAHASSAELHNSLGEVLWAIGRFDDAEAMFRQAVAGGRATV